MIKPVYNKPNRNVVEHRLARVQFFNKIGKGITQFCRSVITQASYSRFAKNWGTFKGDHFFDDSFYPFPVILFGDHQRNISCFRYTYQ